MYDEPVRPPVPKREEDEMRPLVIYHGTFRKSGGSGSTTINPLVGFANHGTLEAQTGTLAFAGGSVFNAGTVRHRPKGSRRAKELWTCGFSPPGAATRLAIVCAAAKMATVHNVENTHG